MSNEKIDGLIIASSSSSSKEGSYERNENATHEETENINDNAEERAYTEYLNNAFISYEEEANLSQEEKCALLRQRMITENRERAKEEKTLTTKPNTYRSYTSSQKEFLKFCKEYYKDKINPEMVTGEKLLLFLNNKVREGKKVKRFVNKKLSYVKEPYALSTLSSAASGVVSLYQDQLIDFQHEAAGPVVPWSHPRTEEVKKFLKVQNLMFQRHKKENNLKDIDISVSYSQDDFVNMIGCGMNKASHTNSYVGAISLLTLTQSLLFRGDSARKLDISDIRIFKDYTHIKNQAKSSLGKESHKILPKPFSRLAESNLEEQAKKAPGTPSQLLVFMSREDKTNKDGSRLTVGSLRHTTVYCCSHFWLSAYLVERFHVHDEKPIVFNTRDDFFSAKAYVNENSTNNRDKMSDYAPHLRHLRKLMTGVGISPNHITHAPRAAGAQLCDFAGIDTAIIERFGWWRSSTLASSSLTSSYLFNIASGPMAALAGATRENGNWNYTMVRDFVKPSDKLKRLVFPFINEILEKYMPRDIDNDDKDNENDNNNGNDEDNPEMEMEMDAPDADGLTLESDDVPFDPSNKQTFNTKYMARTVATVLDYLRTVFLQDYKFIQESFEDDVMKNIPLFNISVFQSEEYLEFRAEQDAVYSQYFASLKEPKNFWENNSDLKSAIATLTTAISRISTQNETMKQSITLLSEEMTKINKFNVIEKPPTKKHAAGHKPTVPHPPSVKIPRFQFKKSPKSFKVLWTEYCVPHHGGLCVKQMNEKHDAKWRNSPRVAKMYARRNVIYKAVENGIAKGISEAKCLKMLEDALVNSKLSRTQFMDKHLIPDELKKD